MPGTNTGPAATWRWPNFTRAEMACRASGDCAMDPDFMDRLQALRKMFGRPMVITSGYRSPDHDRAVRQSGRIGAHGMGRAADIWLRGADAIWIVEHAAGLGFTGFGLKQHGPFSQRFVHLDDLVDIPGFTRPTVWTYE